LIKAIIFDFDGVIVESVDIKTKAFAKLFESESQDVVEEIVSYHLQHTGVSRFEKFQYIFEQIMTNSNHHLRQVGISEEKFTLLLTRSKHEIEKELTNKPIKKRGVRSKIITAESYDLIGDMFF
jgi:beta-phosphoglucomutase-like phosphatase (HAD superfamily)